MKKAIIILSAFLTLLGCKAEQEQIPQFSDITLLAGGYSPKKPDTWTEDRAKAHVTYTDESGKEHWLFEAFIFWAGRDYKRGGLDFAITAHNKSAVKESWLDWIDYWFNEQTGAVKGSRVQTDTEYVRQNDQQDLLKKRTAVIQKADQRNRRYPSLH